MQIAIIGLGRMGANITRRLMRAGHDCVVYDVHPPAVAELVAEGAKGADSLADLVSKMKPPRALWMMVPAAVVERIITELDSLLEADDVLIDGGNSFYRDDMTRAEKLGRDGIHYLDVGTSGGVWGLERGYCQMIGGEADIVRRLGPVFAALAPGVDAAPRGSARRGAPTTAEQGYLHCGPSGAGHFVKMVHNGIEYGVMAAYAEGFNLLHHANAGKDEAEADAETAPMRDPQAYQYDFDVAEIAELWRRGSVIGSWLLDLTADALGADPALDHFAGRVSDSGEGRWTAKAAVDLGVPAHVLTAALYQRFASRGEDLFAGRVLSAMRHQFGGHHEKPEPDAGSGDKETSS